MTKINVLIDSFDFNISKTDHDINNFLPWNSRQTYKNGPSFSKAGHHFSENRVAPLFLKGYIDIKTTIKWGWQQSGHETPVFDVTIQMTPIVLTFGFRDQIVDLF